MYWGKYVQHDNNRDGMGQFLELTQNTTKTLLEWHADDAARSARGADVPLRVDRHGPVQRRARSDQRSTSGGCWRKNDVMEMTKRGVPGVWTYGFYDGWVPNYMFFIAHTHNAIGRFYEVQSYGPDNYVVKPRRDDDEQGVVPAESAARLDQVGPAQQHEHPGVGDAVRARTTSRRTRRLYLENYWLKNKRAVDKGKNGPDLRVGDSGRPARARPNAAEAVNELRAQGLEVHTRRRRRSRPATWRSTPGDYIIRGDQPYRTLADMYFSLQNFAPANPSPYDDTGWTFPLMRNITITDDRPTRACSTQPMTLLDGERQGAGRHRRHRQRRRRRAHQRQQRSSRSASRTRDVKMPAAEEDFDADGHKFRAGAIIIAERRSRAARAGAQGARPRRRGRWQRRRR